MRNIVNLLLFSLLFFLIGSIFGYSLKKDESKETTTAFPSPTMIILSLSPTSTKTKPGCFSLNQENNYIDPLFDNIVGDIDNDGEKETLVFYRKYQFDGCAVLKTIADSPLFLRILSGKIDCLEEEFGYDFNRELSASDNYFNQVGAVKFYSNFFNREENAFAIPLYQTGCGSGASGQLFVLTYAKGGYKVIPAAKISTDDSYRFTGRDYPGRKLIIASLIWGEGEAHFDPHHYQLDFFVFDENLNRYRRFDRSEKTNFKYRREEGDILEQIFNKEPALVNL
jgi:hypothetical protein